MSNRIIDSDMQSPLAEHGVGSKHEAGTCLSLWSTCCVPITLIGEAMRVTTVIMPFMENFYVLVLF